ncbi:putative transcription factor MYB-HB-like family [Helianthus anomalus]
MSEPPPNTSTTPPYPATISYKNHHLSTSTIHGGAATIRDYRKGNWTPEETLILITAKRLDDERRITTTSSSRTGGELRWKWVENYCWSNGCLRSQNQCNDKWDNLLRDYKKVRDYQNRSTGQPSYWAMDKTQRKHLNLPSNMLPNIYEALNDVVQKKHFPNKTSFPLQQPLSALPPPPAPLPPPPPPPASGTPTKHIHQLPAFILLSLRINLMCFMFFLLSSKYKKIEIFFFIQYFMKLKSLYK